MSTKKRVVIVISTLLVGIAIIVAAIFGANVYADACAKDIDGTYSFTSANNPNFNLTVSDGHFSLTNPEVDRGFSGSIDDGNLSNASVTYRLTDLSAMANGVTISIIDLIKDDLGSSFDDSDISAELIKKGSVQLTVPRGAARGNVVGTWELSFTLLNMKAAAVVLIVGQDGSFTYSSQTAGKSTYDEHGSWNDLGNGHYALYDSDGDLITNVSMAH